MAFRVSKILLPYDLVTCYPAFYARHAYGAIYVGLRAPNLLELIILGGLISKGGYRSLPTSMGLFSSTRLYAFWWCRKLTVVGYLTAFFRFLGSTECQLGICFLQPELAFEAASAKLNRSPRLYPFYIEALVLTECGVLLPLTILPPEVTNGDSYL